MIRVARGRCALPAPAPTRRRSRPAPTPAAPDAGRHARSGRRAAREAAGRARVRRVHDPRVGADRARHLLGRHPRPVQRRRPRRQALPDLASAHVHEPGHGRDVHVRPRARRRPGHVGHRAVGRRAPRGSGYESFAGLPFGLAAEALTPTPTAIPGRPSAARTMSATRSTSPTTSGSSARRRRARRHLRLPDGRPPGQPLGGRALQQRPRAPLRDPLRRRHAADLDDAQPLRRPGLLRALVRAGDPHQDHRQRLSAGRGRAAIPDRECVERNVLVPAGRTTSAWALYEKWTSANTLTTPDGTTLASFDTSFGVFNPSRYANAGATIGRTLRCAGRPPPTATRPTASTARWRRGSASPRSTTPSRRSTAPAATSTSPARPSERGRPAALLDRPVRRQRAGDAVSRRGLPARLRHRRAAGRDDPGLRPQPQPRRARRPRAELTGAEPAGGSAPGGRVNGRDGGARRRWSWRAGR